jgi:hypothetical protein
MKSHDKNICLLITATVIPCVTKKIALTDPIIRANQYKNALKYALSSYPVNSIVFCENSGSDLQSFIDIANHDNPAGIEVEFLMQDKNDEYTNHDIGFREMNMVSNALCQSKLLASADYIIKLTGRHTSPSIPKITDFLCKYKDIAVLSNLTCGLSYADSRCFAGTPVFFQDYLVPFRDIIDGGKGIWFEHALARAINKAVSDGMIWSLPPKPIIINGQSGTTGQTYRTDLINYAVRLINHRIKWIAYGCYKRLEI